MHGTQSAGAIARLLTVCAALAGLFLMHGLPAQACAAGTDVSVTTTMAAAMDGHSAQPALVALTRSDETRAVPGPAEHGTPCVFTPAPSGINALLALLLLAAAVALASPARPPLGAARYPRSHRAPPRTGTELLTRLCVSRT